MFNQTLALFIDSYREFQAKKVFLISLGISALVVVLIGLSGMTEDGNLSILWFDTTLPIGGFFGSPAELYKSLFMAVGLTLWLTWGATILALVSTAGAIPDFLAAGSVDLALSKPIGRARLLLTKYAASMLFVAVQVAVFTTLSFFVIGVRGGAWEPALFLAVPLVTIFYSYLYSFCALCGVITRSAMTSLIATVVLWLIIFVVHGAEMGLLGWRTQNEVNVHTYETRLAALERRAAERTEPDENAGSIERAKEYFSSGGLDLEISRVRDALAASKKSMERSAAIHGAVFGVKTVLPKTAETIALLERWLIDEAGMRSTAGGDEPDPAIFEAPYEDDVMSPEMINARNDIVSAEMKSKLYRRSIWWVVGTSLVFESAVLALATWRFRRRDF